MTLCNTFTPQIKGTHEDTQVMYTSFQGLHLNIHWHTLDVSWENCAHQTCTTYFDLRPKSLIMIAAIYIVKPNFTVVGLSLVILVLSQRVIDYWGKLRSQVRRKS